MTARGTQTGAAAEWVRIAPYGEFPHRGDDQGSGPVVQVLDRAGAEAMVRKFDEEYKRHGKKLLIDNDHASYDMNRSTEAFGWVHEVEARDDGIWGLVKWTEEGQRKVENRSFQFLSPVWMSSGRPDASGRVSMDRLDSVALTNRPNIQAQAPLRNRAAGAPPAKQAGELDRVLVLANRARTGGDLSHAEQEEVAMWRNREAAKFARENRVSFTEAWNEVMQPHRIDERGAERRLAALLAHNGALSRGEEKELAELLTSKAKLLQNRKPGMGFEQAWRMAATPQVPTGSLANREDNCVGGVIQLNDRYVDFNTLKRKEAEIRDADISKCEYKKAVGYQDSRIQAGGGTSGGPGDIWGPIRTEFKSQLEGAIRKLGDHKAAWEQVKRENPVLFWDYINTFCFDRYYK